MAVAGDEYQKPLILNVNREVANHAGNFDVGLSGAVGVIDDGVVCIRKLKGFSIKNHDVKGVLTVAVDAVGIVYLVSRTLPP